MMSQCALVCSPVFRDCVLGICEVGDGAEGGSGEIRGGYVLRCFGVSAMEGGYQSLGAFDILGWSPLIFFNAKPFPVYQVF